MVKMSFNEVSCLVDSIVDRNHLRQSKLIRVYFTAIQEEIILYYGILERGAYYHVNPPVTACNPLCTHVFKSHIWECCYTR